ncbi:MAG: CYTH domain-containing protein [Eubacteriales bacterium]|nr:CYTH domain-containing protein [Eubacteriales bacterium]
MEIERKFLIHTLPESLTSYPHHTISQAYVNTSPVIRIRQKDDTWILTVKSKGAMAREELELPLTEEEYLHLFSKKEGIVIEKNRYRIPDDKGYVIELDVFHGVYDGLVLAEVEFPSLSEAEQYIPPKWFGREVTTDFRFHNSNLSCNTPAQIRELFKDI